MPARPSAEIGVVEVEIGVFEVQKLKVFASFFFAVPA